MNERQRQAFAEKLMDVGNLTVGALLLGSSLLRSSTGSGLLQGEAFGCYAIPWATFSYGSRKELKLWTSGQVLHCWQS